MQHSFGASWYVPTTQLGLYSLNEIFLRHLAEKGTLGSRKTSAESARRSLMKRIPPTAGSEWNDGILSSFKIQVTRETSFKEFFGVDEPSVFSNPDVEELLSLDLLHYVFRRIPLSSIRSRSVKSLVADVIAVTKTHRHEESAVDDMSRTLLQLFEYDGDDTAIRSRTVLDLFMSRGKTQATPAIVVEELNTAVKMLVQEDKSDDVGNDRNEKGRHPEAQLISEAIAAYQENERLHTRLGLMGEFPDEQLIPGIVMLGTCPTFYLIPVSKALANCVRLGEQPSFTTHIRKYMLSQIPRPPADTLLYRPQCLHCAQCLEAFKRFL